jgi:hypothetical protein
VFTWSTPPNEQRSQDPYRKILHSAQWQKTRKLVRARDQDRCRLEGVGEPCGGRIEVHHIVGVRQGGAPFDPTNCACLCRLHHEDVEHGRIGMSGLTLRHVKALAALVALRHGSPSA